MWWTTHPAAYTRCCSGSQVPCYYFSLIGTIRACFLNHKEHTAEKKMVDFALPSSPSLIFTTQSYNFSRLMSPFVSHKFPVIVIIRDQYEQNSFISYTRGLCARALCMVQRSHFYSIIHLFTTNTVAVQSLYAYCLVFTRQIPYIAIATAL